MGEKGGRRGREVGGKGEGTGNGVPPVHPLCLKLICFLLTKDDIVVHYNKFPIYFYTPK